MTSVSYAPNGPNVQSSSASGMEVALNRSRSTMSAEDIMAYVQDTLANIDGGFERWKKDIEARKDKADKIRALISTIRGNLGPAGGIGGQGFDAVKAALDKAKNDPELYNDPQVQEVIKNFDGMERRDGPDKLDDDRDGVQEDDENGRWYEKGENGQMIQNQVKNLEDKMTSMNSDNELVMMNLQKLMQQRNQVTQFSSNVMNMINETLKGVIGNLR